MTASMSLLTVLALTLATAVGVVGLRFIEFVARQRTRRVKTQTAYVRAFNHSVSRILSQPETPDFVLKTIDRLGWAIRDDAIIGELERSFHASPLTSEDIKAHEDRMKRIQQLSKTHPMIAEELRAATSHAIAFLVCRSNILSDAMPEMAEELMSGVVDEVEKAVVKVRGANKTKNYNHKNSASEIVHAGGH